MNFGGRYISAYNSALKIHVLLKNMFILIPTALPPILTHSNINSNSKISTKAHLNQVCGKLEVWLILREDSSPAVNLKTKKCTHFQIQGWNKQRLHISILKGRNRKEQTVTVPKQVQNLAGKILLDFLRLENTLLWLNTLSFASTWVTSPSGPNSISLALINGPTTLEMEKKQPWPLSLCPRTHGGSNSPTDFWKFEGQDVIFFPFLEGQCIFAAG